jgi:hypothetical protein
MKRTEPSLRRDRAVHDVVIALRSELSFESKHLIIGTACWLWSGAFGKYVGCPYWTAAALDDWRIINATPHPRVVPGHRWRHEHVVPRAVLIPMILTVVDPTPECVRDLLQRFAIGCVVTLAQDAQLSRGSRQSMPSGFSSPDDPLHLDPWARYRERSIIVRGPLVWENGAPAER